MAASDGSLEGISLRTFSIHEVIAMSGLTRGQIDQLISRWGFGVYGRSARGKGRDYHPTDVFNFMVAGELSRLGVGMPMIREACITSSPMYRWDRETDAPAEMYPGQGSLDIVPGGHRLCFFLRDGELAQELVRSVSEATPAVVAALVIDASGLAARVVKAASRGRVG